MKFEEGHYFSVMVLGTGWCLLDDLFCISKHKCNTPQCELVIFFNAITRPAWLKLIKELEELLKHIEKEKT
jgi:hypothetical protein